MLFCHEPSQVHSAHVGQMVEFHYRWHPYYGGRFRHEGREDRANGAIIRAEIRPGEIIQVAEWMLDRAFCAGMKMGEPRVAVIGLLSFTGCLPSAVSGRLRRMDSRPSRRRAMKALPPPSTLPMLTQQLSMPLDTPQMRGLSDAERSAVVARLATLLMAAAGVAAKETSDDEQ